MRGGRRCGGGAGLRVEGWDGSELRVGDLDGVGVLWEGVDVALRWRRGFVVLCLSYQLHG